jgi:hypothetical protein
LESRLTPTNQLLPDLVVQSSFLNGWYINSLAGGHQEIRFATAVENIGAGAFELDGTPNYIVNSSGERLQVVDQKIYQDDGTYTVRQAGTFSYDEDCGDMHFDDMASAALLLRPNGTVVGGEVAQGEKNGFCLIDSAQTDPQLAGSPNVAMYKMCGAQVQGISVGWTDIYSSVLDGQSIDITGIPNGDYWLQVTVDPKNHIQEANESDNMTRIPITITSQPSYGFRVLAATPLDAIDGPVSSATLTFNQAVNAATLSASNFSLYGPTGNIPITSATLIDQSNVQVNFATQTRVGTYSLTALPTLTNAANQELDQNNNGVGGELTDSFSCVFTIAAPKILATTPNAGVTGPLNAVRIEFNKPIVSSTFTVADILGFTGPGGINLLNSISAVTPVATTGTSTLFDVAFAAVNTPGLYHLTVGPNVTDALGHTVDQNLDGQTDASDNYTASFAISAPATFGPDLFGYTAHAIAAPTGSIVNRPGVFTIVTNADDLAAQVNLGANTINYYGTTYTGNGMVWVSTNGLITFGTSGNNAFVNDDLTMATTPSLAVLWDDWTAGSGNPEVLGLFDDTNGDGVPDRLIIEWNQVKHNMPGPSDTPISFQAVLELNSGNRPGNIICNYLDLNANNSVYSNGASATVGMTPAATDVAPLRVSFNSPNNLLIGTGKAIEFDVPRVQSVIRLDPSPNATGAARYQVSFSVGVTGVDPSDFSLTTGGSVSGTWISAVTATNDPSVWYVTFQWFHGAGSINLNVLDDDTILSLFGARLGGLGLGNGQFSNSPSYSVTEPAQERIVVGADAGGGPHVRVIRASDQKEVFSFFAFDASFRGGVRVAQGDVNGDGVPDIIVAAGPGGGPHVKVFDGRNLQLITEFFAYAASFHGGVWVASADVNHDGKADIITGADAGGGPHVRVFSGANGAVLTEFFAYAATFTGGVRVAAADVDGDGFADIITGAGPGGGPHVKVSSGADGSTLQSYFAFDASYHGGVYVAAGDYEGNGKADVIVGAGNGFQTKVFGSNGNPLVTLTAPFNGNTAGGVRIGCTDLNGDGKADLILSTGPGNPPNVLVRDTASGQYTLSLAAFDPSFLGGVYVA